MSAELELASLLHRVSVSTAFWQTQAGALLAAGWHPPHGGDEDCGPCVADYDRGFREGWEANDAAINALIGLAVTWHGRANEAPEYDADIWRKAAEELEQAVGGCHCGKPVHRHEDGFTRGLCRRCDEVRCDAEPGACKL